MVKLLFFIVIVIATQMFFYIAQLYKYTFPLHSVASLIMGKILQTLHVGL